MKARRLIDGAAFGPETVKAMGEAFRSGMGTNRREFWRQSHADRKRQADARRSDAVYCY
jgi:hypothetical protein